jgi:hypothetical protein
MAPVQFPDIDIGDLMEVIQLKRSFHPRKMTVRI